jgi:hypothetical protein
MPVVTTVDAPMHFHSWTPASAMGADRHGIPIPADGAQVVPDIVLLPLVAFDAQGFRLGYGGGYFDRTLAAMVPRPRAIGVGFELARVPTSGRRRTTCASTRRHRSRGFLRFFIRSVAPGYRSAENSSFLGPSGGTTC